MSNSYPERSKATVLPAFETLFNRSDYASGRRPVTERKSARRRRGSRSGWSRVRFAAALLVMLASFVGGPNAALAAAAQHHDQVPGFYRLKVGDLEVTALLDGPAVLDLHWLTGEKATLDGVVKALHEDPHMLDAADTGFLVNTGQATNPSRCGLRHLVWWGSVRALGREPPQSRLHTGRSRPCFGHSPPLRSRRRPHDSGRKSRLSKCRVLRREGRKRLLAVAGNRCQGAEGCATVLPECPSHCGPLHQGRQVAHV